MPTSRRKGAIPAAIRLIRDGDLERYRQLEATLGVHGINALVVVGAHEEDDSAHFPARFDSFLEAILEAPPSPLPPRICPAKWAHAAFASFKRLGLALSEVVAFDVIVRAWLAFRQGEDVDANNAAALASDAAI